MTLDYRYFGVQPIQQRPGRKTVDYTIIARDGDLLGRIEWYAPWRQHVLAPTEGTVWSAGCLADVQHAIEKIKAHERERAAARVK
jgi:hypothetical protein